MNDIDKKEVGEIVTKAITDAFVKFWESVSPTLATKQDLEDVATKQDLEDLATKQDVKKVELRLEKVEHKVDILSRDVKEIRGRVLDVEIDTPTRTEFNLLKSRVDTLKS